MALSIEVINYPITNYYDKKNVAMRICMDLIVSLCMDHHYIDLIELNPNINSLLGLRLFSEKAKNEYFGRQIFNKMSLGSCLNKIDHIDFK